jgi:hypothetical protein
MSEDIVPVDVRSLEVYDRITDPMLAIKTLGQSIFRSGIFGVDKVEQGEILAMQCLTEKKSPLELARTYHFIQGQLAIRTDALLAKFNLIGGNVTWITRTDTLVEAEFAKGNNKALIRATIEEYTANGTALGKDGKIKENWKKWPRRMLTARAISEGVRLIAPECCFGVAVSDEAIDISYSPRQNVSYDIRSIIPQGKEDAAVVVLKKVGMLQEGQGLDDVSQNDAKAVFKNREGFINSINNL